MARPAMSSSPGAPLLNAPIDGSGCTPKGAGCRRRAAITTWGMTPRLPLEECELSASGDERHDDIGGVPVEALSAAVVDRGSSRIGVGGGGLAPPPRAPTRAGGP